MIRHLHTFLHICVCTQEQALWWSKTSHRWLHVQSSEPSAGHRTCKIWHLKNISNVTPVMLAEATPFLFYQSQNSARASLSVPFTSSVYNTQILTTVPDLHPRTHSLTWHSFGIQCWKTFSSNSGQLWAHICETTEHMLNGINSKNLPATHYEKCYKSFR